MGNEHVVMEKSGRYQPAIRGIVGGVVLVAALAAFLGSSQSEAGIEQRATAFWEARIQGDDLAAYQYETYAHTGKMTATQYIQALSPMLKYMAYTIDTIQEQENEASVTVNVRCRIDIPGMLDVPLSMPIKERWVRLDDSQWYRNVKPEKLGKAARRQG